MAFYTVVLLDEDDCEISREEEVRGKRNAIQTAEDKLIDPEYTSSEPRKVEVRDEQGVCVWDKFYEKSNDEG